MRTILMTILLAGAASPALAAIQDFGRSDRPRAERSERESSRTQRSSTRRERSSERREARSDERSEAPRPSIRTERPEDSRPTLRVERPERPERDSRPRSAPVVIERNADAASPARPAPNLRDRVQREAGRTGDSVRDWRANERRLTDGPSAIQERNLRRAPGTGTGAGRLVEPERPLPQVLERNPFRRSARRPPPDARPPEPATARLAHARPSRHWRTDWRRDRRFDWHDDRRRHRSLFRLSFYIDPFGWNYRRYGVGWRLWPSYYSSHYWLNDPWMYRLPPAYGPYRWVRYWDDALLVNIYTGEVVDVIHDFFW